MLTNLRSGAGSSTIRTRGLSAGGAGAPPLLDRAPALGTTAAQRVPAVGAREEIGGDVPPAGRARASLDEVARFEHTHDRRALGNGGRAFGYAARGFDRQGG